MALPRTKTEVGEKTSVTKNLQYSSEILTANRRRVEIQVCELVLNIRHIVKTELIPTEPMSKPPPFSSYELWAWSGIFIASFVGVYLYPIIMGTTVRTCLPFLLAATVLGYNTGTALPSGFKMVFHPIICYALSADLAAFAFGYISKSGIEPILGYYLTKVSTNPGAGDILMGFLGSIIISFAFSMFK